MSSRLVSIDVLRALVMILMTIDHAREYSSGPGRVSDPMDLSKVTPLLYTLRWLSHFCAPTFALLMGISAGFRPDAARLAKRGLMLLLLEFTIIDWSWTFNPLWHRKFWQVIAALGASCLLIAALSRLGHRAVLAIGALILATHNLFDHVRFPEGTPVHYVWSFLHQMNVLPLGGGFEVRTTYPFLPLAAIAMLGYGIAPWFRLPDARRRLAITGAAFLVLFVLLRTVVGYGDAGAFGGTLMSLGNVTKYPVSLQFALMTLGPALLFLSFTHPLTNAPQWILTLGRSPLIFYVAHLYLLHALALLASLAMGLGIADFSKRFGGIPEGFGFPLWVTVPFALATVAILVFVLQRYQMLAARKHQHFLLHS
ncbi:hypothetical protein F183_A09020 [Bryobacterales bacterium F-183]|nr:hypothetical protein F183_A09020 [Bryobacterales bacterium F-183]